MILEGIVTTISADGEVNVAPMGPHLPDLSASTVHPRRDPLSSFVLKPFRGSRTWLNLSDVPEGVFHIVDDALLIAQAAVGEPNPMPLMRTARHVRGFVLLDACRHAEFRVVRRDDRTERSVLEVEVLHVATHRDFFGINRALSAVVEAAILATRTSFLPRRQIEEDYRKLAVIVEKTGGTREKTAFALLEAHVARAAEAAS